MPEINSVGYENLRDHIDGSTSATWDYIALNNNGSEILRRSKSDSTVSYVHADGSQTLQLEIVVTGSDSDVTLPQTFDAVSLWDSSSGGNELAGPATITDATLQNSSDQVTITANIEVPQV